MAELSKKLQKKLIHHLKVDEEKEKKRTSLNEKIVNKLAEKKAKEDNPSGSEYYKMVRSKTVKGPDGYGKVISVDREKMINKLGKDPGKNTVVMHKKFGIHKNPKGEDFKIGTRAENTAESNKNRAKKGKKK